MIRSADLMDRHLKELFYREIIQGCENAFVSIRRLDQNLRSTDNRAVAIYENLYSFLGHAAAVSLILWPSPRGNARSRSRSSARGAALRAALAVRDLNALSNRTLRDHIVHMDERIDEWWETSNNHNIVGRMVGSRNAIVGIAISDIFEHFIPNEGVFIFRGEEFDLRALVVGLEEIQESASDTLRDSRG